MENITSLDTKSQKAQETARALRSRSDDLQQRSKSIMEDTDQLLKNLDTEVGKLVDTLSELS